MLITKYLALALAPLAIASPLSLEERAETPKEGAKSVIAAISTITAGIAKLNASVNKLKPDDPTAALIALQIQQDTSALEDDLKKAIAAAKASPKWNNNLSAKVATKTLKLKPKIKSLLNNIVVHKPAFASAVLLVGDLSKTVEQSLITQEGLSEKFGAAITAKLSKIYASLAPKTLKQITGYFKTAIKAYKKCTGLVCLPPIPG